MTKGKESDENCALRVTVPGKASELQERTTSESDPGRGVDSISKCNRIRNCRPVLHEVECAFWQEQFGGRFPAQRFPGPGAEQPRDVVQFLLGKDRQIGSLGQILAEQ